jgi:hypothetical protein
MLHCSACWPSFTRFLYWESAAEKQAALATLGRLQQKSAQSMAELGVTEANIDRELQD